MLPLPSGTVVAGLGLTSFCAAGAAGAACVACVATYAGTTRVLANAKEANKHRLMVIRTRGMSRARESGYSVRCVNCENSCTASVAPRDKPNLNQLGISVFSKYIAPQHGASRLMRQTSDL